jgi:hypothetical protein
MTKKLLHSKTKETREFKMIIINATPHDVHLIVDDTKTTFEKSGILPRVNQNNLDLPSLDFNGIQIPLKMTTLGEIIDLPLPQPNVFYIVSLLVLEAGKKVGRKDLIAPDTLRDEKGNIIGCKGFIL